MADHSWLSRALVMILTMREDDAGRWDPAAMVEFARGFSVDALGFSVGGITAFYPTAIPHHTRSRSLGGRDPVGETVRLLHREGMRAIGRIDPSLAPAALLEERPDWFARDADGRSMSVHGYYVTCPNGGYYRRFMPDVVEEILARYPLDGLWANAAKFAAWHTRQCFCENCQRRFRAEHGAPVPREDWEDPVWRQYNEWRYRCIAEWIELIARVKEKVRPSCAWLPLSQVVESWDFARSGGWDVDSCAPHQDGLVLEAQRRYTNVWWPGVEARYLRGLEPGKPAAVTVSYFYPWWRFYRTPVPENRAWTAQIVANGARPWLHITGYLSEHFDRRALGPLRELFGLFGRHPEAYEGTRSLADVALVYSRHSLDNYGRGEPEGRYLNHFRGYCNALLAARIPFDVLSDKRLAPDLLARYRVVVLPNVACLSEETAGVLARYVEAGGHLVATFETGLYDLDGTQRRDFALAGLTGVHYAGTTRRDLRAAYGRIRDAAHPLFAGIGDTDLLPFAGDLCAVRAGGGASGLPVTFVPPVEGEAGSGFSVPEFNRIDEVTDEPLAFQRRHGKGSVVYFPWQPDAVAYRYGLRDLFTLLANAIRTAPGREERVEVAGPGLIDVSVMAAEDRLVVHLVNLSAPGSFQSGHRRPMEEIVPLRDVQVTVRLPEGRRCGGATLVASGGRPAVREEGSRVSLVVPRLDEFESVVLELT